MMPDDSQGASLSDASGPINALEADRYCEELRTFDFGVMGNHAWMKQHEFLQKLNLQAHVNDSRDLLEPTPAAAGTARALRRSRPRRRLCVRKEKERQLRKKPRPQHAHVHAHARGERAEKHQRSHAGRHASAGRVDFVHDEMRAPLGSLAKSKVDPTHREADDR